MTPGGAGLLTIQQPVGPGTQIARRLVHCAILHMTLLPGGASTLQSYRARSYNLGTTLRHLPGGMCQLEAHGVRLTPLAPSGDPPIEPHNVKTTLCRYRLPRATIQFAGRCMPRPVRCCRIDWLGGNASMIAEIDTPTCSFPRCSSAWQLLVVQFS